MKNDDGKKRYKFPSGSKYITGAIKYFLKNLYINYLKTFN